MDTESRAKFSELFRGLTEKQFPEELIEKFNIPEQYHVEPLKRPYIFQIPKQGTIFDYRFTKEVNNFQSFEIHEL